MAQVSATATVPIYQYAYRKDDKGDLLKDGKGSFIRNGKENIGEYEAKVALNSESTGSGEKCKIDVQVPAKLPKKHASNETMVQQSLVITGADAAPYLKALKLKNDFCAEPIMVDYNVMYVGPKTVQIPEMVAIPGRPGKMIMVDEVSIGLFKQVIAGYKFTGHNADKLTTLLDNPANDKTALVWASLLDAREFAKQFSALTGRNFRVQTDVEWEAAKPLLKGGQWTWTETSFLGDLFVLRRLGDIYRGEDVPGNRFGSYAVRLVEDK